MRQRILSSLLLLPLIAIVWFGGSWVFAVLVGIVSLLGIKEFYSIFARLERQFLFFGFLFTSLFIANAYFDYDSTYTLTLFAAVIVIPLVWFLFRFPRGAAFIYWEWMLAGILYVGWMLGYYVAQRGLDQGKEWVLLILSH